MVTKYRNFTQVQPRRKEEKYDIEPLFNKPLIHRQITGDEVYIPLDPKRLWGM